MAEAQRPRRRPRKIRRFRPENAPPGPIGTCGAGVFEQFDIDFGDGDDDTEEVSIFDIPQGVDKRFFVPELATLSRKVNRLLQKEGLAAVRKLRKKLADNSVQLTIAFVHGSFYLVYARPLRKKPRESHPR